MVHGFNLIYLTRSISTGYVYLHAEALSTPTPDKGDNMAWKYRHNYPLWQAWTDDNGVSIHGIDDGQTIKNCWFDLGR